MILWQLSASFVLSILAFWSTLKAHINGEGEGGREKGREREGEGEVWQEEGGESWRLW